MGQRLKLILDPASSMRSFYFNKKDDRVLFGDIREDETHVLCNEPHLLNLSEKSWMRKKYGVLDKDTWRDDLRKGFGECFRVLKTNGTLIFKWNEHSIPLKSILELTDQVPVLGHPSGKRMNTHWVLFIK